MLNVAPGGRVDQINAGQKLDLVISQKEVEVSAQTKIKDAYLPFLADIDVLENELLELAVAEPDVETAKKFRLRLVKIRKAAEHKKEERKRIYLLMGNIEQASFNIIKTTCELREEQFKQIEDAEIIKERQRIAVLQTQRLETLQAIDENYYYPGLGEMDENVFESLVMGEKAKAVERMKQEVIEEKARIAGAKASAGLIAENARLKAEKEKSDKIIADAAAKKADDEAAAEKLAGLPDVEKLKILADTFFNYQLPDLKSKKGKKAVTETKELLKRVAQHLNTKIAEF